MRKLIWLLFLVSTASLGQVTTGGGTVGGNILPDQTGRNIGNATYRWNGYFQNLDVSNVMTLISVGTSGANGGIILPLGDGTGLGDRDTSHMYVFGQASDSTVQIAIGTGTAHTLATTGPSGATGTLQLNLGGGAFGASHVDDGATTAGTITSTEPIFLPDGTNAAASLQFHVPGTGFFWKTTNSICYVSGGDTCSQNFSGGSTGLPSGAYVSWSTAATDASTTKDIGLSRVTAGVLGVGNGSQGSTAGIIESANAGTKVTSDYTNATTTPSAVWTSPALTLNKPWTFTCDGAYQTNNNTTGTLLLAVNFQVAPVNAAMTAQIWSTNTNTATSATVTGDATFWTAATNKTVLTGAAENATGTNYQFRIYGAFEQKVDASGTISLMAAAGGTGTITIPRDSIVCRVF